MSRYIVVAVLFVIAVGPAFSRGHKICISVKDATDPCPMNETMSLCGTMCEPTCERPEATSKTPLPIIERCPHIKCTQKTTGCRCEEDFVRNEQGMCVDSDDCPK